jgi:hypothetical protein
MPMGPAAVDGGGGASLLLEDVGSIGAQRMVGLACDVAPLGSGEFPPCSCLRRLADACGSSSAGGNGDHVKGAVGVAVATVG